MIISDQASNYRYSIFLQIVAVGCALYLGEKGRPLLYFALASATIFWLGILAIVGFKLKEKFSLPVSLWQRFGFAVLFFVTAFGGQILQKQGWITFESQEKKQYGAPSHLIPIEENESTPQR